MIRRAALVVVCVAGLAVTSSASAQWVGGPTQVPAPVWYSPTAPTYYPYYTYYHPYYSPYSGWWYAWHGTGAPSGYWPSYWWYDPAGSYYPQAASRGPGPRWRLR